MTNRLTANLVIGCALSALTAGCTVHTYSARPEYPGTVFVSHGSSTRHEASFHTDRSRERATYRPDDHRPSHDNARERTTTRRDVTRREVKKPDDSRRPASRASAKPSRRDGATDRPRTGAKNDEHVVLVPVKPDTTKPDKAEPQKDRAHILSFRERLENYVDKTDAEVAQRDRERRKRMSRAIGAAAEKSN